MAITKITLFDNYEDAKAKYDLLKFRPRSKTLLIGPTDVFRITGQSPNTIEWKSGEANDWYMLIDTAADIFQAGNGFVTDP